MTVKQRKRNNKRKRVTKKLKGGGLFFKNDEQKKAELEKKKKKAIQLMKAICSRQELHNMMISTCTYLFDRYIYQDPKDPKDTEVTNEYPKPRLYKGDLIKLQKVIQKIVYKYNAILNKVFFTTDFEEKDTMIKNVKNIFYTKQQYDFFSKLKNLAADQTNKVSVPINTPIVTESAVEKIEETDSMINNHTEEQLNVNIEETANGKIEQEKTKDLQEETKEEQEEQEETKEEQSQQSTNTLSNESIYKKKIYDNFFSPPLLDTTKQYELHIKTTITEDSNHPYNLNNSDNFFTEFVEFKNYMMFFNIYLKIINDIIKHEKYPDGKEAELNYLCKRVMTLATVGTAGNAIVGALIKPVYTRKNNDNDTNKVATKGGKIKNKTKKYKKLKGGKISDNIKGYFTGIKDTDEKFKNHKNKAHFLIFFYNIANLYSLNAFDETELEGFSNEDKAMTEDIIKRFQITEIENDTKIYQTLYDKIAYNRIGNKIMNIGKKFSAGDYRIREKTYNMIRVSLKFVSDNPVIGPLVLLLSLVTNATCYAAPLFPPLAPLLMAVSLGTMILRNGVAIAAAPIIIPPSIVIANKAKIKDAFNSFLMKKFASDDIKGDNFVDKIIESTNVIDELRKLQLGIKLNDYNYDYSEIIQRNDETLAKFKFQFDSFFENKTTKLEKKDPEKTESEKTESEKTESEKTESEKTESEKTESEKTESEKKELMYLYYYRKANISISDDSNKMNNKLSSLKDTIVKMKEQERDRFKQYIINIIKYELDIKSDVKQDRDGDILDNNKTDLGGINSREALIEFYKNKNSSPITSL